MELKAKCWKVKIDGGREREKDMVQGLSLLLSAVQV